LHEAGTRVVPERLRALSALARTLHAVSPLPTLARGYAVVTDAETGRAIGSIEGLSPGLALRTQLRDGRVVSRVESTEPGSLEDS
jgi:exodeoxyribonuclease VII large subunit